MTHIYDKKGKILERNRNYTIIFFTKKELTSNWTMNISLKIHPSFLRYPI